MMAINKKQMIFSYDNSIIASNSQQPPVTSATQPLIKFLHFIIT